jgi:hypothetical protein
MVDLQNVKMYLNFGLLYKFHSYVSDYLCIIILIAKK